MVGKYVDPIHTNISHRCDLELNYQPKYLDNENRKVGTGNLSVQVTLAYGVDCRLRSAYRSMVAVEVDDDGDDEGFNS